MIARNAPEASVEAPTPATFTIGDVVQHRVFAFRGVIFDVDPVFNNTEEWWQSIPEAIRPHKNQPFYHLFAENEDRPMSPMSASKICCLMAKAIRLATRA